MNDPVGHGASFRDPSGYVYTVGGELRRSVSEGYLEHYRHLMDSGLYRTLAESGRLVAHEELPHEAAPQGVAAVLRPHVVPFVSYPWEWCFSQLKDAALLTLDVAWQALDHDMVLKDASAFNVQFEGARPVFIDTLSFERYVEGELWVAYRQFCQHFLAPLELIVHVHPAAGLLSRTFLDGVPLDVADAMLPPMSHLRPAIMLHIHAHRRAQRRFEAKPEAAASRTVSKRSHYALIDSLRSAVKACTWEPAGTQWADYYAETNYVDCAMDHKVRLVSQFVERVAPKSVWDLGANTGRFSRIAAEKGAHVVAFDVDPGAVERCYREARADAESRLVPLVTDLMNPTPDMGWALGERQSVLRRGAPDVVLALALVHHLAIANNVPLPLIAEFFSAMAPWLVIEFVPKSDSQVQRLLASRKDIFDGYGPEGFEHAFGQHYEIVERAPLEECERVVYLMRRRVDATRG